MEDKEIQKIEIERQKENEKLVNEANHKEKMKSIKIKGENDKQQIKYEHYQKMETIKNNKNIQLNNQNNNFNIENKKLDYQHEIDLIDAKKGLISVLKDIKGTDENMLKIMANLLSKNKTNK
jgi:hypothetical protein